MGHIYGNNIVTVRALCCDSNALPSNTSHSTVLPCPKSSCPRIWISRWRVRLRYKTTYSRIWMYFEIMRRSVQFQVAFYGRLPAYVLLIDFLIFMSSKVTIACELAHFTLSKLQTKISTSPKCVSEEETLQTRAIFPYFVCRYFAQGPGFPYFVCHYFAQGPGYRCHCWGNQCVILWH